VESTGELHDRALGAGLVWRRGSIAERTEFQTAAMRLRQQELEREFP
jgi:hypothetical protein